MEECCTSNKITQRTWSCLDSSHTDRLYGTSSPTKVQNIVGTKKNEDSGRGSAAGITPTALCNCTTGVPRCAFTKSIQMNELSCFLSSLYILEEPQLFVLSSFPADEYFTGLFNSKDSLSGPSSLCCTLKKIHRATWCPRHCLPTEPCASQGNAD